MYRYLLCLGLMLIMLFNPELTAQTPSHRFPGPNDQITGSSVYSPAQIFSDSAHMAWISIYNDPINGDDEADAMARDSYGNIYVTGNCSDSGASYGWDITTVKYNSDGVQQWLVSFDGPGHGDDVPYDIAVDQHCNVYIAGYGQQNGAGGTNFLTMKIDSAGTIAWSRLLANSTNSLDAAFSVAVDADGNVFSTGATFVLSSGGFDLTTVKYNTDGVQQWIQRYNSPFSDEDTGDNLLLDANDNIYITGVSAQFPGNYDVITMKYNSSGVMQWVERYNGHADSNDGGIRLALDENLNVIVTGYQTGEGTLFDMLTIKYDNNGNQLWTAVYNGPMNSEDASNRVVVDPAGNIYITGFVTGTNNTSDYATLKYTPGGALIWASFYYGPANGFEQAYGIALDNSDGVYITGYSPSSITPYVHYEYATVKYDTSGQEQWVSRYGGNSNLTYQPNVAMDIVLDNSGGVYVTGEIADEGTGEDFGTIKYTQNTVPVELTSFTAAASGNDVVLRWQTATETNNKGFEVERQVSSKQPDEVEVSPKGGKSVSSQWEKIGFVAGYGTTSDPRIYSFTDNDLKNGTYNYRLKQIDFDGSFSFSNAVEVDVNAPLTFSLNQNYPNPFNPSTQIDYSIPKDGFVSLKVYNTIGQEVATLVNGNVQAGSHEVTFNPESMGVSISSGAYYYRLESDGRALVKKMMVLK